MSVKTKKTSEHYIWGDNCDGWHLLKTDSLSVIQEKMPAGTQESMHYHSKAQQFFYILKGTATFHLEGNRFEVNANQGFHILSNQKHNISNNTTEDLEFIVISEPKAHGDRVNL